MEVAPLDFYLCYGFTSHSQFYPLVFHGIRDEVYDSEEYFVHSDFVLSKPFYSQSIPWLPYFRLVLASLGMCLSIYCRSSGPLVPLWHPFRSEIVHGILVNNRFLIRAVKIYHITRKHVIVAGNGSFGVFFFFFGGELDQASFSFGYSYFLLAFTQLQGRSLVNRNELSKPKSMYATIVWCFSIRYFLSVAFNESR